jgi:Protein of unknown function (DUF3800)
MDRVFIDEVGNHDVKSSEDPNHQYLGLTGVIMRLEYESDQFTAAMDTIKAVTFGNPNIVLHRREMLDATPPFQALQNSVVRGHLDTMLLKLLAEGTYRVFTVVIDKKEHLKKYVVWRFHPYHYCLTVLLERYVQFLDRIKQVGDVLTESSGKKENMQLERAYRYIYENRSAHVPKKIFQERLTSGELKIKPKSANVAGLQFADLIASPSCRSLICERTGVLMTARFGQDVEAILRKSKYLRRPSDGEISGWGKKWLP